MSVTTDRSEDTPPRIPLQPYLYRDTLGWYLGVSAYWFATSFKWFILFLLLSEQIKRVVPQGTENSYWGAVVALGAAEAMIGPALFGYWSDRLSSRWGKRRPFLAVGAGLTALALLFLGKAESLWMMVVGYLLLQISDDVATGPYAALIPDQVPEEKRGRASGVLSQLQLLAQIGAAVVGLALSKSFFVLYAVIAVINVVCALITLFTVRERPFDRPIRVVLSKGDKEPGLSAKARRGLKNWLAPWQTPDFRWVWFTRFLVALGFYLLTLYARNYLDSRVKVFQLFGVTLKSALEAAIVVALIISLSGAVSAIVAGKRADRIGRKKVIVASGWVMFAALVPFALIPNYQVIAALAAVFGAGYGAYLSASWALAADVLPSEEDSGKDMGIWQASVSTPQIISGLVGLLVDAINRGTPGMGYTAAFLLSAMAFLTGSLLVTRVRGSR